MTTGACLCDGIAFDAKRVALIRDCHCSMCRKEMGSAFGTLAIVEPQDFRFVRGEDLVQFYEYPPDGRRAFSVACGSKTCWWEISDSLPRFEKWVPGYEPPWARRSQ